MIKTGPRWRDTGTGYDRVRPVWTEERRGLTLARVLVALDGSGASERALTMARAIAQSSGAEVFVLRVLSASRRDGEPPVDALDWEMARQRAHHQVTLVAAAMARQDLVATGLVAEGRATEQILRIAQERSVDLIVLSAVGRGGASQLGGTAHQVIEAAQTSVLVLPAHWTPSTPPVRRLFLPLDGSTRAECVLPLATRAAQFHRAVIELAQVVPIPVALTRDDGDLHQELVRKDLARARAYLEGVQQRLAADGLTVRIHAECAPSPYRHLEVLARRVSADLVVLAAHGRSGDPSDRYGGAAARFLYGASLPVLVVQDMPGSRRCGVDLDSDGIRLPEARHHG